MRIRAAAVAHAVAGAFGAAQGSRRAVVSKIFVPS